MIFVLALMVAVASTQPIETIATSGGVSLSTQLWNWGQAAFKALLVLAEDVLGACRNATTSTTTTIDSTPSTESTPTMTNNNTSEYCFINYVHSFFYSQTKLQISVNSYTLVVLINDS